MFILLCLSHRKAEVETDVYVVFMHIIVESMNKIMNMYIYAFLCYNLISKLN
jgi:hypothetical protein